VTKLLDVAAQGGEASSVDADVGGIVAADDVESMMGGAGGRPADGANGGWDEASFEKLDLQS
jgi:hypothetical protein